MNKKYVPSTKCPEPGCGSKMKFKDCTKKTACFECKKCGCIRCISIDVLKKVREDWWNL